MKCHQEIAWIAFYKVYVHLPPHCRWKSRSPRCRFSAWLNSLYGSGTYGWSVRKWWNPLTRSRLPTSESCLDSRTNMFPLSNTIQERQLKFLGHSLRRPQATLYQDGPLPTLHHKYVSQTLHPTFSITLEENRKSTCNRRGWRSNVQQVRQLYPTATRSFFIRQALVASSGIICFQTSWYLPAVNNFTFGPEIFI